MMQQLSQRLEEVETCLKQLDPESRKRGLKINVDETKIVKNDLVAPRIVKIQDEENSQVVVIKIIYMYHRVNIPRKQYSAAPVIFYYMYVPA